MQRYFGRICEKQVILENDDVFHLTKVMRARVGEKIEIVDNGEVYQAEVKSLKPLHIALGKHINEKSELPNHVILVASLVKGDHMDLILQKATELGASEIVLLSTERTVVKIKKDDKDVKFARFNKILKEAAEQCKRKKIPYCYRLINISQLKDIKADVKLIAYEDEKGSSASFNKAVQNIKENQTIAIVIGPEGGFTQDEVELAFSLGYKVVGLGRRILRAETAAFYALSVISNFLERK
ncbi:MAG: 16S rRNA (uracil(1498)-N(3))-methyltransferase [bacterium]|nr:16S rRNA (uracil(1498)-N(3))-methyltransferase [bacterium]